MSSRTFQMLPLVLAVSLLPACAFGGKERIQPLFPPAADMKVEPKPLLKPEDLGSDAALDAHDFAIEQWGDRGWRAVARICRWAKANGATVECLLQQP